MTIKTVLRWIASMIWVVTLCACEGATEGSPSRPNILIIRAPGIAPGAAK